MDAVESGEELCGGDMDIYPLTTAANNELLYLCVLHYVMLAAQLSEAAARGVARGIDLNGRPRPIRNSRQWKLASGGNRTDLRLGSG